VGSYWSAIKAVPGWFGSENQGAGIAVADINRTGRPDLVVFHVDNPGGENHGYYRVGWNLDDYGNVTGGWSDIKAVSAQSICASKRKCVIIGLMSGSWKFEFRWVVR